MRGASALYAGVAIAVSCQLASGAAFTSYANSSISTTTTSSSSDVASSPGIGAYIAQGLGLSSSGSTSGQLSISALKPSFTSSNGSSSQSATITPAVGLITTGNQTNFTGDAGVCQNSWNTYWSLLGDYQTRGVTAITRSTTTTTFTASYGSFSTITASPTSTIFVETTLYSLNSAQESSAADLGYVPWAWGWDSELSFTKTTSKAITEYKVTAFPITGTTTLYNVTYSSESVGPAPTPPPCAPAIDADKCISLWSTWSSKVGTCYSWQTCGRGPYEAAGDPYTTTASLPPPNCYRPPVNSSYCSTLRSLYLGPLLGGYYDVSTAPTQTLAPGCTLGCGRCTLTAQTFQILYWPTQTANNSRPASRPATAVVDGSVTLTSPQVYLSFKDVGATDYCTALPETIRSGIVAINSDALAGYGQVDLPSSMGINPTTVNHYLYATALPWSQFLSYQLNNIPTFHLSIPKEVETLRTGWGSCVPQGFGVAEPPSALTPTMMITPVGPVITSPAVPALAITSTVASTTQTTPIAQTPIPGPRESSESAALQTSVSAVAPISSPGAQETPQGPSDTLTPSPQSSEGEESATPQAPASTAVPTPSSNNGSPQIQASTPASTPQPGQADESTEVAVSPTTALISTAGTQETAPASPPQPSKSDESLLPLVSIITAALGSTNAAANTQTSAQQPYTSSSSVPIAFSAITEQSETGGLQGPQPTQTPQAQVSGGAQVGNSNDVGDSVADSSGTAVAVQPSPTTAPVSAYMGYGASSIDSGNDAGNTDSNSGVTAIPIFVPQIPSPSASGSSGDSSAGSGNSGSNFGTTPGDQSGSSTNEILLTIGSTVVTARQTVVPASGSIGDGTGSPPSPESAAPFPQGAASSPLSASSGLDSASSAPLSAPAPTSAPTALPVIVFGSSTLTAGGSAQVIQGQTVSYGSVSPGGQGTPGGLGLVVGTSTTIVNLASSSSGTVSATAIASGVSTEGLADTASRQISGTASTSSGDSGAETAASSSASHAATSVTQAVSDGNVLVAGYWKWTIALAVVLGLVF
ncbi:hypothetical protein MBLNU457_7483t3 [Dothideomycetes sp. NU457]